MNDATGDTIWVGYAYPSGASDFNIDFMVGFRFAFFFSVNCCNLCLSMSLFCFYGDLSLFLLIYGS